MKRNIYYWALWGVYFYSEVAPADKKSEYVDMLGQFIEYMGKHGFLARWSISRRDFEVRKMTIKELECQSHRLSACQPLREIR